jgi:DNA-directed RNA polymerase specialized sigma24 family protein
LETCSGTRDQRWGFVMADPQGSISQWIEGLKAGDDAAARRIWNRYFSDLVRLARARLRSAPSAAADEEDVALSAFHSLCAGASQGHFPSLDNRDDLWRLLVTITLRKAFDQMQHQSRQKRGGARGSAAGPAAQPVSLEQVACPDPTPEVAALLAEQYCLLFDSLRDETLKRIARLRMEGYTGDEIAEQLGCTRRTVSRKVELIRTIWQENGSV